MRHLIEWVDDWAPAAMVWDDAAGTLDWVREPDDADPATLILVQELVDLVDRARREGPVAFPPDLFAPFVLNDAAHDAADFLGLLDFRTGAIRRGDVRLPRSLQGVELTVREYPTPPPAIIY